MRVRVRFFWKLGFMAGVRVREMVCIITWFVTDSHHYFVASKKRRGGQIKKCGNWKEKGRASEEINQVIR